MLRRHPCKDGAKCKIDGGALAADHPSRADHFSIVDSAWPIEGKILILQSAGCPIQQPHIESNENRLL